MRQDKLIIGLGAGMLAGYLLHDLTNPVAIVIATGLVYLFPRWKRWMDR